MRLTLEEAGQNLCYLCNSSEIIILFKLKKIVAKGGMESTDIIPKEMAKSLINGEAFFV